MEWYTYIIVIAIGIVAGIINTLAAGGSLADPPGFDGPGASSQHGQRDQPHCHFSSECGGSEADFTRKR